MRKKTAAHATKRQADSPSKKSGLIAKEKNSPQSAMTKSVLDNHSHRTTLRTSCTRVQSITLPIESDATVELTSTISIGAARREISS